MPSKFYKIRITEYRDPNFAPSSDLVRASEAHQAALEEWRQASKDVKAVLTPTPEGVPATPDEIEEKKHVAEVALQKAEALEIPVVASESTFFATIKSHPKVGTFGFQELIFDADGNSVCIAVTDENGVPYPEGAAYGYELASDLLDSKGSK